MLLNMIIIFIHNVWLYLESSGKDKSVIMEAEANSQNINDAVDIQDVWAVAVFDLICEDAERRGRISFPIACRAFLFSINQVHSLNISNSRITWIIYKSIFYTIFLTSNIYKEVLILLMASIFNTYLLYDISGNSVFIIFEIVYASILITLTLSHKLNKKMFIFLSKIQNLLSVIILVYWVIRLFVLMS